MSVHHLPQEPETLLTKAIFFDIDGTLIDSNDLHVLAWEEALAAIGVQFARQVIHDQIGKGADMLVPTLPGARQGRAGGDRRSAWCHFKAKYLNEAKPSPGHTSADSW